jgi:phosphatidylserine/phosphatidylglycerophosphate/cardiolipin synthase-like enzyme
LETSLVGFYNEKYHTKYQYQFHSIQRFFNEWDNEYSETKVNENKYHELSTLFYLDNIQKEIHKLSEGCQQHFKDLKVKFETNSSKWKEIKPFNDWFPLHINCNLTPYNDSVDAYREIYEYISNSKVFIYITGWSLDPDLELIRDNNKKTKTLGELLIEKSNSGVCVNLLLWKETGSRIQSNLETGDVKALDYFKNTKVNVKLNRRFGYSGLLFSHHQKSVIMDTLYDEKVSIISFLGGLDLTGGRYDNESHHLFSTLNDVHKNDIFSTIKLDVVSLGPRLPWHDIHCK